MSQEMRIAGPGVDAPLPGGDFELVLGRGEGCAVRVADPNVSRRHARLFRAGASLFAEDLGSRAGTFLNGRRLEGPSPIDAGDSLALGAFVLRIEPIAATPRPPASAPASVGPGAPRTPPPPPSTPASDSDFRAMFADAALLCTPEAMSLKRRLHSLVLERMNLAEDALDPESDETLLPRLEACVSQTLREHRHELPGDVPHETFRQALMDELVGYGPVSPILRAPDISEIMVNGPDRIFVESRGRLFETGVRFLDDRHLQRVIRRVVEPLGRHVDDASPMVDARLPDGSRVNAIVPPLALDGSSLTIRRFAERKLTTDDLVAFGTLTPQIARFLELAVRSRRNIVVSGGTGSGKTTLLNILSQFIPSGERIVTIEDSAELKLSHRDIVRLEARPANIEGKGRVTIRDLVVNALRMRPDRIVVGECRGPEALDMLQAMNTGHDGSLTTCHANAPRDALARLETMVMMAGYDLPSRAIREQIASAVNIVVQQTRLADGTRKIVSVEEVTGLENGVVVTQPIYEFVRRGIGSDRRVEGFHTATGNIPLFVQQLRNDGEDVDMDLFTLSEPA